MIQTKNILLFLLFAFSLNIPKSSFTVDWTQDEKNRLLNLANNSQTSWGQAIGRILLIAGIQVILGEILMSILSVRKTEEEKARDKMESILSMNHELKNQINWISPLCNKKRLEKIRGKFINAVAQTTDNYDEYLHEYSKKIKNRDKGAENQ